MRRLLFFVPVVFFACRENRAQVVPPTLELTQQPVDFGAVRVDRSATREVMLTAANGADVTLTSVTVEGSTTITLEAPPEVVPGRSTVPVVVRFSPVAAVAENAELVIHSNDERLPEVRLPLLGHGAYPRLAVELACDPATRCEAMLTAQPPQIAFAPEPFVRLRPLEVAELPKLVLRSTGEVDAVVSDLALGGADVAAFSFVGNATLPDGGMVLMPGASASVPLRFRPTSDTQLQYAGEVVVGSDDPAARRTPIALTGALRPNFAPQVCANVARVTPIGGLPRDYDTASAWAEVLGADGGVDLSVRRDVPPRAEVVLSALSSPDETTCTADPEDGRLGLTWAWTLTNQPSGSTPATLLNANQPRASLRPVATGSYTAQLAVTDSQGNTGTTSVTFEVAVKNDLVVQLDWGGAANVDLDLHLVRPGAPAFAPFAEPDGGRVSGDLNGYSATSRADGGSFDWGAAGTADDPRLNFDDTGSGPLLENISLNGPENDEACAAAPCTYAVYVHGFRDSRPVGTPVGCAFDGGCADGDACDCPSGTACVATVAPADAGVSGSGRCLATVPSTVRIFLKGSATPELTVPVTIGAPCQMFHAADVTWPARGSDAGIVVTPRNALTRFGIRGNNSLQCAPDGPQAGVPWYRPQPR